MKVSPFYMGKYVVTQAQWFTASQIPSINRDLNPQHSKFKAAKRLVERVDALFFIPFYRKIC